MAGFLYYLPKFQGTPTVPKLREMGLGYAFDVQSLQVRGCDSGPDNEGGQVVVHPTFPAELLGYYRDSQKWRKLVGRPADSSVWVGMYTDKRPTPKDLARERQISGQWIEGIDGQQWLLPTARRWEEFGDDLKWNYNLPTRHSLTDDGKWEVGSVLPRYERLWELAMLYEDALAGMREEKGEVWIDLDDSLLENLFVECLKTNYRVDKSEIDLLGIKDSSSTVTAGAILVDQKIRIEWFKKKALGQRGDGLNS